MKQKGGDLIQTLIQSKMSLISRKITTVMLFGMSLDVYEVAQPMQTLHKCKPPYPFPLFFA